MKSIRKILFPFAILYGFITEIRNFLYDKGFFTSYSFDIPIIAVGNLSVGGTGKTPQIEYLIRLLSQKYAVATLSRGYKRKSKGFVLADSSSDALQLGDEPFQFYQKYKNIKVAVDADRKHGIEQLLTLKNAPELILLDDAFQHRRVKAGFYILLTSYEDLYCRDFMLPTGNLREPRKGAKRADCVVVTKCPNNLSESAQNDIKKRLKLSSNQSLFFSFIDYDSEVYSESKTLSVSDLRNSEKVLLAGIAKPNSFFEHLKQNSDQCLVFEDHHNYSQNELQGILKIAENKIIVTTEKDYARLKGSILSDKLYYLPIKTSFVRNAYEFDNNILDYVGKSTRDC